MKEFPKRKLNRLKNYDYANEGVYFITICSKDKINIFSEIRNIVGTGLDPVRLELTKIGKIIKKYWQDIPNQYKNINIDEFIIMPNHIYGIVMIDKIDIDNRTGSSPVPTYTLSQIIGSFKSKSSLEYLQYIKKNNLIMSSQIWQRSFYDHIIRDEESLKEIREYINNNPFKWGEDKYFCTN